MQLQKLTLEQYKCYREHTEIELAPLTILVGSNNAGKSALAQAVQLVAGGVAAPEKSGGEPLPLESGGIRHADTFVDLVAGRSAHGRVGVGATFALQGRELSLWASVQNVVSVDQNSERQIRDWRITSGGGRIRAERISLDERSEYNLSVNGRPAAASRTIRWRGLLPVKLGDVPPWLAKNAEALRKWAGGMRHLKCPRKLAASPFLADGPTPTELGVDGANAPLVLASDEPLREAVRDWYRGAFGVRLDIRSQGTYLDLVVRESGANANVQLAQSGAGLTQVLPVAVAALTARDEGPGVEVIEHPEAELHPAAHGAVADLLLCHLPGPERPVIVETHSEMLLLRARRWVAEGRLPADHVVIYWVNRDPENGARLRRIRITEEGGMDGWPEDVFIEEYEEILAIRRASRVRG